MENTGKTHGEHRKNTWSPQGKHREHTGKSQGNYDMNTLDMKVPLKFWFRLTAP